MSQKKECSSNHLEKKSEELERYNQELERFTSLVCHEIQEPLRKIKTYGMLVQENEEFLNPAIKEYIAHMLKGAEHMENVILSFLELCRTSKKELFFKKVNLNQTVAEVLQELETILNESKADVIKVHPLPTIEADPLQMIQLFSNIITNALKFCKKDPIIVIQSEDYKNFTRIMIQDNGIGIPSQYIDKIFTPFFKVEGQSSKNNTGIGLSICKKIIERHQGHIFAESSERLGTIIVIDLPRYYATAEEQIQ